MTERDWFANRFSSKLASESLGRLGGFLDELQNVFPKEDCMEIAEKFADILYKKAAELESAGKQLPESNIHIPFDKNWNIRMLHHVKLRLKDGSKVEFTDFAKEALQRRRPYLGSIESVETDMYEYIGSAREPWGET